jgi:hypothetical protein
VHSGKSLPSGNQQHPRPRNGELVRAQAAILGFFNPGFAAIETAKPVIWGIKSWHKLCL